MPPNTTSVLAPAPVNPRQYRLADAHPAERPAQLTPRAVLTGGLIGMVMAVSNLYISIRVGMTFGIGIVAAILSYASWDALRKISANRWSRLTLLESACMQSTASAAGCAAGAGVGATFAALMILDPQHAQQPWWVVTLFASTTTLMGIFLAIPFKRQLVNAEDLPFPSATAAAATLQSLYQHGVEAVRATYVLLAASSCSAVMSILSTAEGQFTALGRFFAWMRLHCFDIHLPSQVPEKGFLLVAGKPLVGFGFDPSMMLVGLGMLVGRRVALSMLGASAVLYFIVTPWLQGLDAHNAGVAGYLISIPLSGTGLAFQPMRWSLWSAASLLVFASLTALALQSPLLGAAVARRRRGAPQAADADAAGAAANRRQLEVPLSWLFIGMLPIASALLVLQAIVFGLSWWLGLVTILVSLPLALVSARCCGQTDMAPAGVVGKIMQLLFTLLSPGAAGTPHNLSLNIMVAGVAANSATGAADLLSDLKLGRILGAQPRQQFIAQALGVLFGVTAVVPAWYFLVPDYAILQQYPVPAAQVWVAFARALSTGPLNFPPSVRYAVLIGGIVGVLLPVLEHAFPRARRYLPSPTGLGLGWVLLFSTALSVAIGAVLAGLWTRFWPQARTSYLIPAAAGMIVGESLTKAFQAMLLVGFRLG